MSRAARAHRVGGAWGCALQAASAKRRPTGLPVVRSPLPAALGRVLRSDHRTNALPWEPQSG